MGKFGEGIGFIFNQMEEDKLWELYLSNPIKEKSYNDWKDEVCVNTQTEFVDLEATKLEAKSILKNFKPPNNERG